MMSIPLLLTLSRILLGPLFLVLYLYYRELGIPFTALPLVLLVLIAISELSDLFDGRFARRYNQVTELGKVLDPMADSLFRLCVLFAFTQGVVQLPLLLVLVFFFRDMIISTLRTVCALKGVALAARMSGKVKAVIQASIGTFILLLMCAYALGYLNLSVLRIVSFYSALVGALYTVYSGIEYLFAHRAVIRKAF